MSVRIRPPEAAAGARSAGEYDGTARGTNIIAASIEAYVEALNSMLEEAHWAGAADDAGHGKKKARAGSAGKRAEFDQDEAQHDTTSWFEQ